jgi:hypothetical protein
MKMILKFAPVRQPLLSVFLHNMKNATESEAIVKADHFKGKCVNLLQKLSVQHFTFELQKQKISLDKLPKKE